MKLTGSLIALMALVLVSCARPGSIGWAIGQIHDYKSPAEMSGSDQTTRMHAIVSALSTTNGINAIISAYHKTGDDAYKERLLFVCWHLTFHTTSGERGRMAPFLQGVLKTEHDPSLVKWAATDLAYCGLPRLEPAYVGMLQSNDHVSWLHGAWGLWKIGSKTSVSNLIDQIEVRRTNSEFASVVRQFVSNDSNQWTRSVLRELNGK